MKNHFIKILIGFSLLVISCSNEENKNSQELSSTPDFLKNYKWTTLPIQMKGCKMDRSGLPLTNLDSITSDIEDGSFPYCSFQTNGDYYAVIRLGAADCYLPILMTYDKNGKLIAKEYIGIGLCGSGPGFHCEEFAVLKKDFSIYTSDTITVAELDSLGEEIKETIQSYVLYKKGKLLSSGKIELTDTIRQILKN